MNNASALRQNMFVEVVGCPRRGCSALRGAGRRREAGRGGRGWMDGLGAGATRAFVGDLHTATLITISDSDTFCSAATRRRTRQTLSAFPFGERTPVTGVSSVVPARFLGNASDVGPQCGNSSARAPPSACCPAPSRPPRLKCPYIVRLWRAPPCTSPNRT